jgi:hypothetical protein
MRNLLTLMLIALVIQGQAQSTIPQKESGSKFSVSCANLYFEIDSTDGARISSFKLDGNELMYVNFSASNDMAGSTFWPSPQNSTWSWPPIANLDNKPYKSNITGNKIKFTSSIDTKWQLRFYKTMYANATDTSIIIDYCIKNEKSSAQSWAPWEVTRVVCKGLTVFARGDGPITGDMETRTEEVDGYAWYDQDNTVGGAGSKFFSDGKGWLAHIEDGDKLFIKKFVDIEKAEAAPDEAEVEVYTAGNTYTELEDQGAYVSIPGKDSITWKVKWFARNLPASVDVSIGSASLTNYIESVINRSSDPMAKPEIKIACKVKVFPNPANEYLMVESNLDSYTNSSLFVYNLQGKVMMKQSISQSKEEIALKNLRSGTYLYELKQNSTSVGRGMISVKR